ncbi:AraC family transcriptional regulator [Formosa haliotis]|uniref:AraC family transcriptional regulator n=1 Tax=Formosa haliotis TaxID=1555194 RepID=UPI000824F4AD|nr:AraC family transcriptional regulator [Formosa haliotis]
MCENIHRELTLLNQDELFLIINRLKKQFNFPIHFHPELELNFILNGKGIKRIVGDNIEEIDDVELTLIGSNVEHGWEMHRCKSNEIKEITIQFHNWLFTDKILSTSVFKKIKDLLSKSKEGIQFSKETALKLQSKIMALKNTNTIADHTQLLDLLESLAQEKDYRLLSHSDNLAGEFENSKKIMKIKDYVEMNFHTKISLNEISNLINMSPSSFNRFIKKRTGKTFINYINDFRIIHATKYLIETDLTVSEISFKCGFNNIANFNRVFKKNKNTTPSEFRHEYRSFSRFVSNG